MYTPSMKRRWSGDGLELFDRSFLSVGVSLAWITLLYEVYPVFLQSGPMVSDPQDFLRQGTSSYMASAYSLVKLPHFVLDLFSRDTFLTWVWRSCCKKGIHPRVYIVLQLFLHPGFLWGFRELLLRPSSGLSESSMSRHVRFVGIYLLLFFLSSGYYGCFECLLYDRSIVPQFPKLANLDNNSTWQFCSLGTCMSSKNLNPITRLCS